MASVLTTLNSTAQSVLEGGTVNLGIIQHKNCQSQATLGGNGITIYGTGYFNVDVSVVFSAPVAGDVTIQMYVDGEAYPGATATETITTATTEIRSICFSTEILKNCCNAGYTTISIVNAGVGTTISNIVVRVKRDA